MDSNVLVLFLPNHLSPLWLLIKPLEFIIPAILFMMATCVPMVPMEFVISRASHGLCSFLNHRGAFVLIMHLVKIWTAAD